MKKITKYETLGFRQSKIGKIMWSLPGLLTPSRHFATLTTASFFHFLSRLNFKHHKFV